MAVAVGVVLTAPTSTKALSEAPFIQLEDKPDLDRNESEKI